LFSGDNIRMGINNKDQRNALVIFDNEEYQSIAKEVLEELKYKVVIAINSNEARLKFANEPFSLIILDHNISNFRGAEYIEGIRRKEKAKSINDIIPVLAICDKPNDFTELYSQIDHVKYLEKPFTKLELKKGLLAFTGNSNVIADNTKSISKDEFLITEGGTNHEMYWVLQGRFQITKLNRDNQNVIIGDVIAGELVGEMSFLDNLPRSASVRALEDSEVLVIPHKKFIDVLDGQPRWFRSLMQTMSKRLRNANEKIAKKIVQSEN
tara:strand:- start:2339 stop:3139 length:801 start_codon:yes stop_codon:yes gene_type:complete